MRAGSAKVVNQLPKFTSSSCNSIRSIPKKTPHLLTTATATNRVGDKKLQHPSSASTSALSLPTTSNAASLKTKEVRIMKNAKSSQSIGQTTATAEKAQKDGRNSSTANAITRGSSARPSSSSSFSSASSMAQITAALTSSSKRFPLFCSHTRNQGNDSDSNNHNNNNNQSEYFFSTYK